MSEGTITTMGTLHADPKIQTQDMEHLQSKKQTQQTHTQTDKHKNTNKHTHTHTQHWAQVYIDHYLEHRVIIQAMQKYIDK